MTSTEDLEALFADGEPPFGPHPGRRSDDTPEGFDRTTLMDQGPERDYTPDEDGGVVHYAPNDRPLCGSESMTAVYTDDPALVAGCADCLELVAEDLQDQNDYRGRCLHCRQEVTARAVWSGARWSASPARTAARPHGEEVTDSCIKTIPFELPEPGVKIAVKVIDQTGMEHMTMIDDPRHSVEQA